MSEPQEEYVIPRWQLEQGSIKPDELEPSISDELDSLRTMAREMAGQTNESGCLAFSRTFGCRMVAAWWHALTFMDRSPQPLRSRLQSFPMSNLSAQAQSIAEQIGRIAAVLDAETAAYQIGLAYTSILPRKQRAELGIYYTPPSITSRLIAQATKIGVDWAQSRVLDPACGGGAFLAPVARRILEQVDGCSPRILIENIANRLRGYEIDPFGAWLSQVTLDAVLLPITREVGRPLPTVVAVCDSLRRDPAPSDHFDLVIGNPPYGRIRLKPAERTKFKRGLFGHANLYGLFTDLAIRHTRPGGVIAYVTPTSFLGGEYFKNLRALLGREAPPVTFDFVSMRKGVFEDVLQETLLATYKHSANSNPVSVHEITPVNGSRVSVKHAGAFPLPSNPSLPWILPRSKPQAQLVEALASMKHRLADWGYTVSTGPLVWNRHKDQLSTRAGRARYPLIWAESITSDGHFIWRAEKKNHTPWFQVRPGDDWLVTSSQCVLLQRTTAKEQNRRLIAAVLPSSFLYTHGAVVIENHINMLRPVTERPQVPIGTLAALLNSGIADRAFRCVSGSVAVSAYELEALPLPDPEEMHPLFQLVRSNASRSRIERECERLFNLAA